MNNNIKKSLIIGATAGLSLLHVGKADAQKNTDRFWQKLLPTNVSATFACMHWIGPEWNSHGQYVGSIVSDKNNLSESDAFRIMMKENIEDLQRSTELYESKYWETYTPETNATVSGTGEKTPDLESVRKILKNNAEIDMNEDRSRVERLKNLEKDGKKYYMKKEEIPSSGGNSSYTYSLEEKNVHKFNQYKNFGIIADWNITENLGFSIGCFNNSYYRTSCIATLNVSKNDIFSIPRLKVSAQFGIVTGYDREQVGDLAYLGNRKSLMGGISIGYGFKNGINVAVRATPAFVAPTLGFEIDRIWKKNKHNITGHKSTGKERRWKKHRGYSY